MTGISKASPSSSLPSNKIDTFFSFELDTGTNFNRLSYVSTQVFICISRAGIDSESPSLGGINSATSFLESAMARSNCIIARYSGMCPFMSNTTSKSLIP